MANFGEVADGYRRAARWLARGHPFFTEKLPSNFLQAGFIAHALPHARILHLVRDPVGTCFSNLRTLFSEAVPYSYDQYDLADFYAGYRRLMRHWHAVLPGRVLDVEYDALVRDPEGEARRIAAFCGLEFEPAMVDVGRAEARSLLRACKPATGCAATGGGLGGPTSPACDHCWSDSPPTGSSERARRLPAADAPDQASFMLNQQLKATVIRSLPPSKGRTSC